MERFMTNQNTSFFEKVYVQTSKNKTAILGAVVLIVAIVAIYGIYSFQKSKNEELAQTAFYNAEKILKTDQQKKSATVTKKDEKPVIVDTANAEEALKKVIEDYPETNAAFQAALLLSGLYSEKNLNKEAIDILSLKIKNLSESTLLNGVAMLKLSYLYEKNKQYDEAIKALDKIITSPQYSEFKPEALLKQALCYESLNQKDKAKEIYEKISLEYSETVQGQQAVKYLSLLTGQS